MRVPKEAPPKLGGQGGAEFVSLGGNCRYMTTGIGTVALPPGRVTAASQAPQRLADECAALIAPTRCDLLGAAPFAPKTCWIMVALTEGLAYSKADRRKSRGDRRCA